jgi:Fe-S-cluster containining protein
MDAEKIADKARNSISKYCIEECKAYCCRKGYLVLKPEEVDRVTQGRAKELEEKKILKKLADGKYSLYMGNYDCPCPSLKDFKCTIHKTKPKTCSDFPLFFHGNNLRLSPRCPAVKNNLMYPYIKRLIAIGYKTVEEDPIADIELYNVKI